MKISDTTYTALSALPVAQQVIGLVEVIKAIANIAKDLFNYIRAPISKESHELLLTNAKYGLKHTRDLNGKMHINPDEKPKMDQFYANGLKIAKSFVRDDLKADIKLQAKSIASGIITMIPVVGTAWNLPTAYRLYTAK